MDKQRIPGWLSVDLTILATSAIIFAATVVWISYEGALFN